MNRDNQVKKTKLWHVLVVFTILIIILVYSLAFAQLEAHIPLFFSALVISAFAIFVLKYQWATIESAIFDAIRMSAVAIILLLIIGMIIGTWILSGVVQSMIYYGLLIIHPSYFLFTAALFCALVATPTGSSWTTAGTVGVALMGVGMGLGIPSPMTAGAILSGAYFGDKMSPLSDTSNLAIIASDAQLLPHIKHMQSTSYPAFIVALIGFFFLGLQFSHAHGDLTIIQDMLTTLKTEYIISPYLLLIPIIIIIIVSLKVPAIPGLFLGAVIGGIVAIFVQKEVGIDDVMNTMYHGYTATTNNEMVNILLTRGGITSMYNTVALIICAMVLGGVLEATKVLAVLTQTIVKFAKTTGDLVLATILTGIITNIVAADQYIAIIIPGRMFKKAFRDKGLATKNLSRALQDSSTVTSAFIPWNTCGAYMIATLSIAPWEYIPYSFFNLLMPLFSIIAAYTGYTMTKE